MQEYNYADEIVKDIDSPLPAKRYFRFYGNSVNDIFKTNYNENIYVSDLSELANDKSISNNKMAAFKEGLKNDTIFL